ncbi:hypothetical protein C8J56DRAFT_1070301 [Mycena floridula]|nr:hypothetical protein C8J56DRAFT_1070301 [Mycena floridula]
MDQHKARTRLDDKLRAETALSVVSTPTNQSTTTVTNSPNDNLASQQPESAQGPAPSQTSDITKHFESSEKQEVETEATRDDNEGLRIGETSNESQTRTKALPPDVPQFSLERQQQHEQATPHTTRNYCDIISTTNHSARRREQQRRGARVPRCAQKVRPQATRIPLLVQLLVVGLRPIASETLRNQTNNQESRPRAQMLDTGTKMRCSHDIVTPVLVQEAAISAEINNSAHWTTGCATWSSNLGQIFSHLQIPCPRLRQNTRAMTTSSHQSLWCSALFWLLFQIAHRILASADNETLQKQTAIKSEPTSSNIECWDDNAINEAPNSMIAPMLVDEFSPPGLLTLSDEDFAPPGLRTLIKSPSLPRSALSQRIDQELASAGLPMLTEPTPAAQVNAIFAGIQITQPNSTRPETLAIERHGFLGTLITRPATVLHSSTELMLRTCRASQECDCNGFSVSGEAITTPLPRELTPERLTKRRKPAVKTADKVGASDRTTRSQRRAKDLPAERRSLDVIIENEAEEQDSNEGLRHGDGAESGTTRIRGLGDTTQKHRDPEVSDEIREFFIDDIHSWKADRDIAVDLPRDGTLSLDDDHDMDTSSDTDYDMETDSDDYLEQEIEPENPPPPSPSKREIRGKLTYDEMSSFLAAFTDKSRSQTVLLRQNTERSPRLLNSHQLAAITTRLQRPPKHDHQESSAKGLEPFMEKPCPELIPGPSHPLTATMVFAESRPANAQQWKISAESGRLPSSIGRSSSWKETTRMWFERSQSRAEQSGEAWKSSNRRRTITFCLTGMTAGTTRCIDETLESSPRLNLYGVSMTCLLPDLEQVDAVNRLPTSTANDVRIMEYDVPVNEGIAWAVRDEENSLTFTFRVSLDQRKGFGTWL